MHKLLFFIVAISAIAATPPQGEEWFRVQFMQDDKPVSIVDHTVRLKRDKFSILIALRNGGSISMNASLDSTNFNWARSGKSLQDFECFSPGTGMAEGLENKENDMSINSSAHNHWFYDAENNHRFNKIEKSEGWITGERQIKKIWVLDNDFSDNFKISQFPKDTFYLVFMKSKTEGAATSELQREYLQVIFAK